MNTSALSPQQTPVVPGLAGASSSARIILQGALAGLALVFVADALAISPADLQQQLNGGESLTLIDVRSASLFEQGHIPNAINIPAAVLPQKELPPLGRVVVYDDGLGSEAAPTAVAVLNRKSGIAAEALEGGLAAWESAQSPTTRPRGMQPEALPMITYDRLKSASAEDLVLVDLRQTAGRAAPKAAAAGAPPPLTDLRAEFPNARITRSPFASAAPKAAGAAAANSRPPLLVLIDGGDGAAQLMARALKANGNQRFVILAGGEEILARKGQPGLKRTSASVLTPPVAAASTNINR